MTARDMAEPPPQAGFRSVLATSRPSASARCATSRGIIPWLGASVLVVIVAIILRRIVHTDGDVSWLLYAAARTLDGATPYRDILEVNPPASILLYMPAVLIARIAGVTPEGMTDTLVFVGTAASLTLCAGILIRAKLLDPARVPVLLCPTLVVLLVLPLGSFAQREHIAVLACLPALALLATRAGRMPAGAADIWIAGIGAGIAIAIKPIFGLAFLGPGIYLARATSWRTLLRLPEAWVAAALAVAYGASVIVLWPDFFRRIVPLMMTVYVPAQSPWLDLALTPTVGTWLGMLATYLLVRRRDDISGIMLVLASAGFEACYFIQGKGFHYHGLPAILLTALACITAAWGAGGRKVSSRAACLVAAMPAATAALLCVELFGGFYDIEQIASGLTQAIVRVSPTPRLLTISDKMPLGRVFAREVGGEWVGSAPLPWVTVFASKIVSHPESDPRFAAAIRAEQDLFAHDIARERPDVIVIDGLRWQAWLRSNTDLSHALDSYREVGRYGDFELVRRKDGPGATDATAAVGGDAP